MAQNFSNIEFPSPYLVYLGDATAEDYTKTGFGIADWAPKKALAECRTHENTVTTGLPQMTVTEAASAGAKSLIIGVAGLGGKIPKSWQNDLLEAVSLGMNIISGAHEKLATIEGLTEAAEKSGAQLIEVRTPAPSYPIATGIKRSGKRLLTVGTDCALGKKYTALSITKEMKLRGRSARFRATGQTGIMIAGGGIPIDSVVSDFIAGAAEELTPNTAADHWDIIEGQGSLIHPGYAAVTLGLLHGSQPDEIILCHDGRTHNADSPHIEIPPLHEVIDMYLMMGRLTNPNIRCRGIALNTKGLSIMERAFILAKTREETGLITFDPVATGVGEYVDILD